MKSRQQTVENLGTQTHSYNDEVVEYVLVSIPKEKIGEHNMFPPPHPGEEDEFERTMRGMYCIKSDEVVVQIPRRADVFSVVNHKADLHHVFHDSDELYGYYPILDEDVAIFIRWDYDSDSWEINTCEFSESYSEEVGEPHDQEVWSKNLSI